MKNYKDVKPGDMFQTDYGAQVVVLSQQVSDPKKEERWFTSFSQLPNHFDTPMKGFVVYKAQSSKGYNPLGDQSEVAVPGSQLGVLSKELWEKHLHKFHVPQEKDPELSDKLLNQANQVMESNNYSVSVQLLNALEK